MDAHGFKTKPLWLSGLIELMMKRLQTHAHTRTCCLLLLLAVKHKCILHDARELRTASVATGSYTLAYIYTSLIVVALAFFFLFANVYE